MAPTADVDTTYLLADQLYVQPDARLEECFGVNESIRMTRQEVAIARSHIEVWKAVATGAGGYVLVLEDDVWFKPGAGAAIDRGWRAALRRCGASGGPKLLFLSYSDAGATAERVDVCKALFRPVRGLWFLSGYVLSREGAAALLRAMPVVGPVDMWINNHFEKLGALALTAPAILQRPDEASENSYSILPYLARAGIVDSGSGPMPSNRTRAGPVFAWTAGGKRERLAMALSMLGLRVRVFDRDEKAVQAQELRRILDAFDALVDPPLAPCAATAAIARTDARYVLESNAPFWSDLKEERLPPLRTAVLAHDGPDAGSWKQLCALLGLTEPAHPFPIGAPRSLRLFRDGRSDATGRRSAIPWPEAPPLDESPWVLPRRLCRLRAPPGRPTPHGGKRLVQAAMTKTSSSFRTLVETFPGNLASFAPEGLAHHEDGAHLVVSRAATGNRPYRSGAIASVQSFEHGRFEAEIKAASGSGLVSGFFLHRAAPRQEIDIELAGDDPRRMLANVYFNPGGEGAALGFGYRGSPCRIDLDFDATLDFHLYAIDWRPDRIAWSVDGRIVHERVSWEPTPLPHLPMWLHGNLWVPRSVELAGHIDDAALPAKAIFRNISVLDSRDPTC